MEWGRGFRNREQARSYNGNGRGGLVAGGDDFQDAVIVAVGDVEGAVGADGDAVEAGEVAALGRGKPERVRSCNTRKRPINRGRFLR